MAGYLLVQISDVHLPAGPELMPGVRPRDNLVHGLDLLASTGLRPDVLLLTGDLADAGDGASYDDLAGILAEAAGRYGARVIYLPGNHDDRDTFRRHLLGTDGSGPVNQTVWLDGLRIIALDSTVPGEDYGQLDQDSLGYLRAELSRPAPSGTVLAMHHPPVSSPIVRATELQLRQTGQLRDAIAGSDVRLILCGHYHHAALGTLGTVPVWVSPATSYLLDPASTGTFRQVAGAAFSRVDLTDDGPTVTVLPIPVGRPGK